MQHVQDQGILESLFSLYSVHWLTSQRGVVDCSGWPLATNHVKTYQGH